MTPAIEHLKVANPHYDIQRHFQTRWSPYSLSSKSVPSADLRACFEAARWAPSSYNEQPWRYIVAVQSQRADFQRLVKCLTEGNQVWAARAPVLAIGLYKNTFSTRDSVNKAAAHDLGAASAFLTMEASRRGLYVHQMIGIEPDAVKREYHLDQDFVPHTALALGYLGRAGEESDLPPDLLARDATPRRRRSQEEFVFGSGFGNPADI